jgi:hypothetical protein
MGNENSGPSEPNGELGGDPIIAPRGFESNLPFYPTKGFPVGVQASYTPIFCANAVEIRPDIGSPFAARRTSCPRSAANRTCSGYDKIDANDPERSLAGPLSESLLRRGRSLVLCKV